MPVTSPKPLWKNFLVFLLPMMASNILQALFGTINNVYLGQMIGVDALAAVTVFFPVMFAFIALVMGLSCGDACHDRRQVRPAAARGRQRGMGFRGVEPAHASVALLPSARTAACACLRQELPARDVAGRTAAAAGAAPRHSRFAQHDGDVGR